MSEQAIARHFRLDENCVPVGDAPRVRVYFAQLRRALAALERGLDHATPGPTMLGMIRSATPEDVPTIARLIRALAEYEKLSHEVLLEEAALRGQPAPPARGLLLARRSGQWSHHS